MHSERYFLQFSYLLYTQKTLLLGLENLLLHANRQQNRQSKPVGNYKGTIMSFCV